MQAFTFASMLRARGATMRLTSPVFFLDTIRPSSPAA